MDHQGEAAYYATCLHAAVEFVMRLETNATAGGANANHSGMNDTVETTSTGNPGMDPTTTNTATTKMAASVGMSTGTVGHLQGMAVNGDDDGVKPLNSVISSNDGSSGYAYDSHGQVITHADTGLQGSEPEPDDPMDDDQDDQALREQDQAKQYDDDVVAVARLGEWLREQQTMEDALVLLQ